MNSHELKILKEIKKDCITLKKKNQLTEFGEGHLVLCGGLLKNSKDYINVKLNIRNGGSNTQKVNRNC